MLKFSFFFQVVDLIQEIWCEEDVVEGFVKIVEELSEFDMVSESPIDQAVCTVAVNHDVVWFDVVVVEIVFIEWKDKVFIQANDGIVYLDKCLGVCEVCFEEQVSIQIDSQEREIDDFEFKFYFLCFIGRMVFVLGQLRQKVDFSEDAASES